MNLEQLIDDVIQKTASHLGQVVQPNVRKGMITQVMSELKAVHNTVFIAQPLAKPKTTTKGGTFFEEDIKE